MIAMEKLTYSGQLKRSTRDVHLQLERTLIPLIQDVGTRSQYADLLKLFYTFYAPLEARLAAVEGFEKLVSGIPLRKADNLKGDLMTLDAWTNSLTLCHDLPKCDDFSEAFGILYVMEGSVLGGKVIANMIAGRIPSGTSLPFSFFLCYGDDAESGWNQFKAGLDSTENLHQPSLLTAATDTFVLFKQWIDRNTRVTAIPGG